MLHVSYINKAGGWGEASKIWDSKACLSRNISASLCALSEQGRAGVGLTIDLSQGYTVDEVDERLLLLHLSLPVPPLQVPESKRQCERKGCGQCLPGCSHLPLSGHAAVISHHMF